jgi:hypothetical protein
MLELETRVRELQARNDRLQASIHHVVRCARSATGELAEAIAAAARLCVGAS